MLSGSPGSSWQGPESSLIIPQISQKQAYCVRIMWMIDFYL